MNFFWKNTHKISEYIDALILGATICTFLSWFTASPLFYHESSASLSPFTSLSLFMMSLTRIASRRFTAWSHPMTLAFLGIVACGNFSSLWIHWVTPELFLRTMPATVPTSVMTSLGLILFCLYEFLVIVRKSPQSAFIVDDILLHLALFPGGLSLLGHLLGVQAYMGSNYDLRVGIGLFEMSLMGCFALSSLLSNPNLFLWSFLQKASVNRLIFTLLFINQYAAPFAVGLFLRPPTIPPSQWGIEFFVMLAGVLATLLFLLGQASARRAKMKRESS